MLCTVMWQRHAIQLAPDLDEKVVRSTIEDLAKTQWTEEDACRFMFDLWDHHRSLQQHHTGMEDSVYQAIKNIGQNVLMHYLMYDELSRLSPLPAELCALILQCLHP